MAMSSLNRNLASIGGAGAGGFLSGIFGGGGIGGKRGGVEQHSRFTPQQESVLNDLLMQGSQNADFDPIEQRELSRFKTQTIPGLAERFTAMDGGQRSSGFQQALGSAGSDLGERLSGMRSQFGMQQLGMGLTPQFENVFHQRKAGGMEQGLGSIMQLLPLLMYL